MQVRRFLRSLVALVAVPGALVVSPAALTAECQTYFYDDDGPFCLYNYECRGGGEYCFVSINPCTNTVNFVRCGVI